MSSDTTGLPADAPGADPLPDPDEVETVADLLAAMRGYLNLGHGEQVLQQDQ